MPTALIRVGRNYRITIPAEARKKLDIREGDYLRLEVQGDKIVLTKADREWKTLRLGKKLTSEEIEENIERGLASESVFSIWH